MKNTIKLSITDPRRVASAFSRPYKKDMPLEVIFAHLHDKGLSFRFLDDLFSFDYGTSKYIHGSKEYAIWCNNYRNVNIPEDLIRYTKYSLYIH